jgi:hypothetical protein
MPRNNVRITLSGLSNFENLLLGLEPEVVKAQIEAIKEVAKEAIQKANSSIPSGWELKDKVVAFVAYYKNNKTFFVSVGIGNSVLGPVRKETDRRAFGYQDPLRYGRWQEHGWKPAEWGMSFSTQYEQGHTRWDNTPRNVNPATGQPRFQDVKNMFTPSREFVSSKKDEIKQIFEAKMTEAFESAANRLFANNTQTLRPENFNVAIDRNAFKEINKALPDHREVVT